MKQKQYAVYQSGGEQVNTIYATCITKAVKQLTDTLDCPCKYSLYSKQQASVRYHNNNTVMSDFVVIEL